MGHARGVILEVAASRNIPAHDFSATQIKQHVCAHGQATKRQVQRAIAAIVGPAVLEAPEDVADAVAVAVCAAQVLARPASRQATARLPRQGATPRQARPQRVR
jgi:Holliday junction resolvasome RuvABC endonuclease subunit